MNRFLSCLWLAAVVALAGCAAGVSRPNHYYVLPSLADLPGKPASARADGLSLGVLEIDLPAYLDRPQLVVRDSAERIELREFARWAGALKSDIQRVLAQDLAVLLPGASVYRRPWPRGARPRWLLALAIDRFDADRAGRVRLYAAWQLLDGEARRLLAEGRERIEQRPEGGGEAAWVAAQGEALAELARRLAKRVSALPAVRGRANGRSPSAKAHRVRPVAPAAAAGAEISTPRAALEVDRCARPDGRGRSC